jgi:hypothetical protein
MRCQNVLRDLNVVEAISRDTINRSLDADRLIVFLAMLSFLRMLLKRDVNGGLLLVDPHRDDSP